MGRGGSGLGPLQARGGGWAGPGGGGVEPGLGGGCLDVEASPTLLLLQRLHVSPPAPLVVAFPLQQRPGVRRRRRGGAGLALLQAKAGGWAGPGGGGTEECRRVLPLPTAAQPSSCRRFPACCHDSPRLPRQERQKYRKCHRNMSEKSADLPEILNGGLVLLSLFHSERRSCVVTSQKLSKICTYVKK